MEAAGLWWGEGLWWQERGRGKGSKPQQEHEDSGPC